jgi:L-lactate dehydrogenase complex protein LldG
MPPDARAEVLHRIRTALGQSTAQAVAGWLAIPRGYIRHATRTTEDLVEQLTDRLLDYDATVTHTNEAGIALAIATRLAERGNPRVVIPAGFPLELLPPDAIYVMDNDLTNGELDACAGVLTEATLAIAETGTIVLQNVPGQGRRAATLVPDYHLCIVRTASLVGSVPEALDRLHATATLPTTFISGPSATADIEMTRIKGVHGPRTLDVILCRS